MIDTENTHIAEASWLIIDTETTGLDGLLGEIVEVSLLRFDFIEGKRVFAYKLSTLIKPVALIDEDGEACRVNGITNDMVAQAPSWAEVAEQVAESIRGAVVIAHNLAFDSDFLLHAQRRVSQPYPIKAGLCTSNLFKRYHKGLSLRSRSGRMQDLIKSMKPTLIETAERFNQTFEVGSHRAEPDAWGCFALWYNYLLPHMLAASEMTIDIAMRISGIEINPE